VPTVYALGASQISISNGLSLSGITQGNGSHLRGATITLESNDWEGIEVNDNETQFADSDRSQRLDGAQDFDGTSYGNNRVVEAEYRLVLEDGDGNRYEALGFNINEPGVTSFATVEGLAFTGSFPPIGEPLTVVRTQEGPRVGYDDLAAPPCFTRGCLIDTDKGSLRIEQLKVGDRIKTVFNGFQEIRWIGMTRLPRPILQDRPKFRPIRIVAGALGQGLPTRDLLVSRQHRFMLSSQIVARALGASATLIPAHRLLGLPGVFETDDEIESVEYFHILFDQHEIIYSEGAPSESLHPGAEAQKTLPSETLAELFALFPELANEHETRRTALPLLSSDDEKSIVARHLRNGKPLLDNLSWQG